MLKTIINNILGFIVGFILGSLLVVFFSEFFIIETEIQIIDIISLIVMVILTYYIASILDKQKEKDKITRELYTNKVFEIDKNLDFLAIKIQDKKCFIQEVNTTLSIISQKLQFIYMSLKKYYSTYEKDIDAYENRIKGKKEKLRYLCTYTPIDKQNNKGSNVEVENGIAKYDEKVANEIISNIEDLKNILFELEVYINNI